MEDRSRLLQIILQSIFCTLSSGLKFVAIAIKIKIKHAKILNFQENVKF